MNMPAFVHKEIEKRIATGRYASGEEVLQRAFEALSEFEMDDDDLLAGAMEGLTEIERGEGTDAEDVFAMLRERNRGVRSERE